MYVPGLVFYFSGAAKVHGDLAFRVARDPKGQVKLLISVVGNQSCFNILISFYQQASGHQAKEISQQSLGGHLTVPQSLRTRAHASAFSS